MMMTELTTHELIWLVLGQAGLLMVMVGAVWIGLSNHDGGTPALPPITIWLVYVTSVVSAYLFTHYFKVDIPPHVPWEACLFRLSVGMGYVAYPVSRRFNLNLRMSRRVEVGFTALVGTVSVVAVGLAGYYTYEQYRGVPTQEAYIARQARANGNLIRQGTSLLSGQVDSLTQLTARQAGQIGGMYRRMGQLSEQLSVTTALLLRVDHKMAVQDIKLNRLLGKPSQPVRPIASPVSPTAVLDLSRVRPIPAGKH